MKMCVLLYLQNSVPTNQEHACRSFSTCFKQKTVPEKVRISKLSQKSSISLVLTDMMHVKIETDWNEKHSKMNKKIFFRCKNILKHS